MRLPGKSSHLVLCVMMQLVSSLYTLVITAYLTYLPSIDCSACFHLCSVQLLFIDGRVSASMLPMMLPKFASHGVYSTYIYPVLFAVLKAS